MGIKRMQGVAAHIEYIRRNPEIVEFVNCKFWKDEICYNNISTKYGERCFSKRCCMYSIPLPKGSKKQQLSKSVNKSNNQYNKLNIYNILDIINNYFSKDLETEIKVENKTYKIKTSYNKKNDLLSITILYKNKNYNFNFKYDMQLKKVIKIQGNQVIFNVKLNSIIDIVYKKNENVAKLIKDNNTNDITRKASINSDEDIIKNRDSLIKYTSYIITRELIKLYK